MNEPLKQAMLRARLREDDVAARLGVDPKTVRRWLSGRVPYPSSRVALADLIGADEADLWPEAGGPLSGRSRPEELAAVYPHRWAIPRDVWAHFFESAEHEIGVLAYSALFLAEDAGLLGIIANKASHSVRVRIALGDPDCLAVAQRGREEGIGDAMAAKVRNSLKLYRPLLGNENIARTTRSSSTSTPMASLRPTPPCSATTSLGAATSPLHTLTASRGSGWLLGQCSETIS